MVSSTIRGVSDVSAPRRAGLRPFRTYLHNVVTAEADTSIEILHVDGVASTYTLANIHPINFELPCHCGPIITS